MHTLISKALTNIKKSDLHASQKLQSYDYVIFFQDCKSYNISILTFFKYIMIFFKKYTYKIYILFNWTFKIAGKIS